MTILFCSSYFIVLSALLEALQIKEHNKPENRNTISVNWSIPSVTFPLCVNVLKIDPYFESMISGMVISIGCLTESVSKNATKHFLDYMHNLKKNQSKVIRKVGNGKFFLVLILFNLPTLKISSRI